MSVKVVNIEWISEFVEATLTLSDGCLQCLAFAHPVSVGINDTLKQPLSCFDCKGVERVDHPSFEFIRNDDIFGYRIFGVIESITPPIVRVGSFRVELGPLPKDILVDEYVVFHCTRLDVMD